jgi:hypothetical protein
LKHVTSTLNWWDWQTEDNPHIHGRVAASFHTKKLGSFPSEIAGRAWELRLAGRAGLADWQDWQPLTQPTEPAGGLRAVIPADPIDGSRYGVSVVAEVPDRASRRRA